MSLTGGNRAESAVVEKYIFIVGLPRTGTKLTKNVLESCPSVCCCISPETWFLGDMFKKGLRDRLRQFGNLHDDQNVRKLVEYMYSGQFGRTYWTVLSRKSFAERRWMEGRILNSHRDEKAIYEIIMEASRARTANECKGKELMLGDKTPGHLYHVPTLLRWFPDAKIVHAFRDPRAILASEWRRLSRKRSFYPARRIETLLRTLAVVGYVTITWLQAVKLHNRYSKEYPDQYLLSKYEDLVFSPEESIKRLCGFLEIDYSEDMLRPAVVGSSFGKNRAAGFDKAAPDRWRQHLKPWMRKWMTVVSRKHLPKFGYRS